MEVGAGRGMRWGFKCRFLALRKLTGAKEYKSKVVLHHKGDLNELYALYALVGACYWEEVGGWLC